MKKSLVGSLPIYAQHLAELTGVKVVVSHDGRACTDGHEVYVPFAEDDLPLSFGYVAHECSHVRNTDMQCFRDAGATPFRQAVLNILEDIRIEQLSIDQYPGTEDDLNHLVKTVLGEQLDAGAVAKKAPLAIVHDTLLIAGRWMVLKQELEQPAQVMLNAHADLLGSSLSDEIMQMACGVTSCTSTQEVLDLVDAILAKLPSEQEEPQGNDQTEPDQGEDDQQQDSQEAGGSGQDDQQKSEGAEADGSEGDESEQQEAGAGGEGEEGDDSDSSSQQGGGQGGESESDGEEKGSDAGSEQKNSPSNQPVQQDAGNDGSNTAADATQTAGSQGGGAGKADLKPEARDLREQAENATEKDLKGLISDVGDKAAEILSSNARRLPQGTVKPLPLVGRSTARGESASQARIAAGTEQSAGLRQALMGMLQAQVDCRVSLRRHGRRIDTGRIAMLAAGETRIYRHKHEAQRHSASIQILLDKSGSMMQSMSAAESAVFAVLKSLENIPMISTGAMSFPDSTSTGTGCALIKSAKESLMEAVRKGGFGACAQGGTPLAEALWPAAVEVLRTKGERKILFVITDGQPQCPSTAKEMVRRCEASGIDVIGLGFGEASESVLSYIFTKFRVVGSVSRLKAELYQVVRESLHA